ncbi:MAG: CatA-like O-acetyltransferase, family 2 [Bacteroidales bacterium]|nr:CatA-like O-acetyltransferase, family 2 [Bacteroidales bacterium]
MKKEIHPQETKRANAFNLWMSSPMPMVTLTKTFDVTHLRRIAQKKNRKFNMLLCWCIVKAAKQMEEFYLLPENGKLYQYDQLAINVIVNNRQGGINSCDIAFNEDLEQFNRDYLHLTKETAEKCESKFLDESMIIGTSALVGTELDSIINQYSDKFCNPMVMWGKYRQGWFKTTLPISFQYHHVQMDGGQGVQFFELLQKEIRICQ